MTNGAKFAFVAFPSQDEALAAQINEAVRRANTRVGKYIQYEPWIRNDIAGRSIIEPIEENIRRSDFIVADITYLNLNVVFEVGYSIKKKKRAFIVRKNIIIGDKMLQARVGIFDTLGYFSYSSANELSFRLENDVEDHTLDISRPLDRRAPVYIMEPSTRDAAIGPVTSQIKKARFRYRSFIPSEDSRLSAVDAIANVASSSGVVGIFQVGSVKDADVHNIRTAFVAGLSFGMEKPTLLLSPYSFNVPIDLRDRVATYRRPDDLTEAVNDFCPQVIDYLQQIDTLPVSNARNLANLTLGESAAENEMTTLANYFLETDEYRRAVRGEVNLVVGRKGSGKTAMFIMIRDYILRDRNNVIIDLRPESYQLLKLKEDVLVYTSPGTQSHLIVAFLEYLLLLEVAYKLLEKDKLTHRNNHVLFEPYSKLRSSYQVDDFDSTGDFSERLNSLATRIKNAYNSKYGETSDVRLGTQEITQLLYTHDLRDLRRSICEYLRLKKESWIIIDNLDKGWSTNGVDAVDITIMRNLIDAARKVERDLKKEGLKFHCIIFLRSDVFEHLIQNSADFGKDSKVNLDWSDRMLLRKIIDLRVRNEWPEDDVDPASLWNRICVSHFKGEDSFESILDRSLMRPRNVIKFLSHAKGYAVNFDHSRIQPDDMERGLSAYSMDIVVELDRELSDVFPEARDLILRFADQPRIIGRRQIEKIFAESSLDASNYGKVLQFLVWYGVIGIRSDGSDLFIFDVGYNFQLIKVRIERAGSNVRYCINPAFVPALQIKDSDPDDRDSAEPKLPL